MKIFLWIYKEPNTTDVYVVHKKHLQMCLFFLTEQHTNFIQKGNIKAFKFVTNFLWLSAKKNKSKKLKKRRIQQIYIHSYIHIHPLT